MLFSFNWQATLENIIWSDPERWFISEIVITVKNKREYFWESFREVSKPKIVSPVLSAAACIYAREQQLQSIRVSFSV